MHLLYIATNFGSLTHTFIAREVTALRRRGHRVDLLALRPTSRDQAARPECDLSGCRYVFPRPWLGVLWSVVLVALKRPRRWLAAVAAVLTTPGATPADRLKLLGQLAVTTTIVDLVERDAPQLIHAHLANPPGSYALFLSLLTGIPFTFTGHAADLYRRPVGNVLKLRRAAGAVAISGHNLEHYRQVCPTLRLAAIVHCGVRPADFAFTPRQPHDGPRRILAVGRAVTKKGFHRLLEALALLEPDRYRWTAHVVGGGPQLAALQAQKDALALDGLTLTGPQQQETIRDLLAAADLFCLPCVVAGDGDVDGIPVSLMEAMAAGCPVVSTRVSGIPELLDDGRAGLLVAPDDAAALAAALRRFWDEPDLGAQLSTRGRAQVASAFDLDREAQRLELFFQGVIDGRLPAALRDRDHVDAASSS